ncbi:MAG: hypothetical protein ABI286_00305 [Edaphobacter sp.]
MARQAVFLQMKFTPRKTLDMMIRFVASPRFLVLYSGTLTAVFAATVVFGVGRGILFPRTVSGTERKDWRHADFDQITVHRINIVEPDGTPRLVLSNKAEYPGSFYHGKEQARPDRAGVAGMLFIDDEGSEDGGLSFGGYKAADGSLHSWGHLSFDEYEQDETFDLMMQQNGNERSSGLRLYDNGNGLLTPEAMDEIEKAKKLPHNTPEQIAAGQKVFDSLLAKYPIKETSRGYFGRDPDKSSVLRLQDQGRNRILLRVAGDGTPTMQFLDATGKVTQQWPQGTGDTLKIER